jgi:hypothetical protein
MFRAFLAVGATINLMMAVFLVIVFGWVLDSWHDPRDAWAGPIVTTCWLIAFVLAAGAPILAYGLRRRNAPASRITLAMWGPTVLLVGICVIGLILSPP